MTLELYSNDSSYYSMIARLVLAEKDVKYNLNQVDIHIKMEQFSPEYVRIQPNMTVPVLVSGNDIFDSSEKILRYVNEHFTGVNLYPEEDRLAIDDSLRRHYAFSIEDLTMGNAMRKSPIAKFALGRGLDRGTEKCLELMKKHPEFTVACQKKLDLEKERRKLILSKENNYEQMLQQATEVCDFLEDSLAKHQYAASNSYSLADVVWTVFIARLFMIKFDSMITSRKNLKSYWQRMSSRESFMRANIRMAMPKKLLFRIMLALIFKI